MAYKLSKNTSSGQYPRLSDLIQRSYGSCFLPCQEETGQAARKPRPGKDASTAMANPFLAVLAVTLFPPFSLRLHRKKQAKQFFIKSECTSSTPTQCTIQPQGLQLHSPYVRSRRNRGKRFHTHMLTFHKDALTPESTQTYHQAMNSMSAN